jgi:hypothetical protein
VKRPRNVDDYSQRVCLDKKMIWCVECEMWRAIRVRGMARVEINVLAGQHTMELDESSISVHCGCGADASYLFDDFGEMLEM